MATESLHKDCGSFNEVTLEKLDIYTRYLREWLPVSASQRRQIVFHDTDTACVESMASQLGESVHTKDGRGSASVRYFSQSFAELQSSLLSLQHNRSANLIFLDQDAAANSGDEKLRDLHQLRSCDLLIFVSSNWYQKFSESNEAESWGMAGIDIASARYSHVHRFISSYFRTLVGHDCFVAPFSLKANSGINTLLFVTHNPLRLEKFLKVAWHKDPFISHKNFDLYDEEISRQRLALIGARKVVEFQKELMACLECGKFRSDRDIYLYTLQRGFLGRHAADTVRAFCDRRHVLFRRRAGNLARPRLSHSCFYRPRPMIHH